MDSLACPRCHAVGALGRIWDDEHAVYITACSACGWWMRESIDATLKAARSSAPAPAPASEDPWLKGFNAAVEREKIREQERAAERAELEELRKRVQSLERGMK